MAGSERGKSARTANRTGGRQSAIRAASPPTLGALSSGFRLPALRGSRRSDPAIGASVSYGEGVQTIAPVASATSDSVPVGGGMMIEELTTHVVLAACLIILRTPVQNRVVPHLI
jgi:hypothetical protein